MTAEAITASRVFEVPEEGFCVGDDWSVLQACERFGCPPWEFLNQPPGMQAWCIAYDRLRASQEAKLRRPAP